VLSYGAPMDQTAALAANQANWDERVAAHLIAYRVEDFIADTSQITAVVRDDLALMRPQLSKTSVAGLPTASTTPRSLVTWACTSIPSGRGAAGSPPKA